MLVLSRREDDKIVFPNLGITVEVLRIAGRSVRLGVKAPANVRVLRHELAETKRGVVRVSSSTDIAAGPISDHGLRNRLNKATIGLSLVQKHAGVGSTAGG